MARPLPTLLSQVLVAFTVEFDNEFERQMGKAGYPGARLSLVIWASLIRFVGDAGISVRDLGSQAQAPANQLKFQLGCLERWGYVVLESDAVGSHRAGWGSARGIRTDWMVRLTPKGLVASRIWPPLFGEIEQRWDRRFGKDEISRLRQSLRGIGSKLGAELPDDSLPTLLSGLLLTFQLEFDRESPAPLELCANTLRVLGEEPIRASEIPRLTGGSPETSDIGWQMKPYVVVASDPAAGRGKLVRLSPRGLIVQQAYRRLISQIEKRWEKRFGKEELAALRESLEQLFASKDGGSPLIAQGLIPPEGTVRAGDEAPALGRRDVGPAARQRMRDLVAQTEAFVGDPAGALPHYPVWDMNRGFGP